MVPSECFYSFGIPVVEYWGEVIILEELLPRRNDWWRAVCLWPIPLLSQTILSLVGTKTVTFPQGTRALTKSQMIPKSFLVPMNASDPTVLTYNHYQMLLWGESEILKMSMSASVSPFRILTFFLPDLLLNFTHATDPVFIPLLSTQNTGEWMAATQPLEACCPRLLNRDWGSRGIVPFKYRPLLGSRGDIFFYCIRFCLKTQDVGCSLDEGQTRLKRGTYWAMRNSWELQR